MIKNSIEKLYEDIVYIKVNSDSFDTIEGTYKELYIQHCEIKYIRKYWNNGELVCYSLDSIKGKKNKLCNNCNLFNPSNIYKSPCQIKLRIYWNHGDNKYCMELANTGIKNFIKLQKNIQKNYKNIPIQIKAVALPRFNNKWGEVQFFPCPTNR
jgi:hypothetical protein